MYNEEICYCSECGSVNKKSAVFCENCEKKIRSKHFAFYDYLKAHIKDELQDRVTDKIYSAVKNYLLSHIYGTVLTVSIVTVAATAVYANYQPHIETVTEMPQPAVQTSAEPETEAFEITGDDIDYLNHVVTSYDSLADYLRSQERFWDEGGDYSSPAQLYAEGNIEGYTYSGVHELYNNPVSIGEATFDSDASHISESRYFMEESIVTGDALTTELGRKLYEEGYEVAEGDFEMTLHAQNVSFEEIQESDANLTEKLVYRMVFVRQDGVWYIAEDRLTERVGV